MSCLQRGRIDGIRLARHANMVVAVRAAVRLHQSGEKVEALLAGVQRRATNLWPPPPGRPALRPRPELHLQTTTQLCTSPHLDFQVV